MVVFKSGLFSRISFSRIFLTVILVMNFDMRKSSCFMFLKSQFFSSVTSFFKCSSGVSFYLVLPRRSLHGCGRYFFGHVVFPE